MDGKQPNEAEVGGGLQSPISTILDGYMSGQISHAVKAGVWWVAFSPLIFSLFGDAYYIGFSRVCFNAALLVLSPIASIVVERTRLRCLLLSTTLIRMFIYSVLLPGAWIILQSDIIVDHTDHKDFIAGYGFQLFLTLFFCLVFLDGVVVSFGNVADVDNGGASYVAYQYNIDVSQEDLLKRFSAKYFNVLDASIVFLTPALAYFGIWMAEHVLLPFAGDIFNQKNIDSCVIMINLGLVFLITSIISTCCYCRMPSNGTILDREFRMQMAEGSMLDGSILDGSMRNNSFDNSRNFRDVITPVRSVSSQNIFRHAPGSAGSVASHLGGSLSRPQTPMFFDYTTGQQFIDDREAAGGGMAAAAVMTPSQDYSVLEDTQKSVYTDNGANYDGGDDQICFGLCCCCVLNSQEVSSLFGNICNGAKIVWQNSRMKWRLLFFALETAMEDALIALVVAEFAFNIALPHINDSNHLKYSIGMLRLALIISVGKVGGMLAKAGMHSWFRLPESSSSVLNGYDLHGLFRPLFFFVFVGCTASLAIPFSYQAYTTWGESWQIISALIAVVGVFCFFFFTTLSKIGFATLMQLLAMQMNSLQSSNSVNGFVAAFVTTVDGLVLAFMSFVFLNYSTTDALWICCSLIAGVGVLEWIVGPFLVLGSSEQLRAMVWQPQGKGSGGVNSDDDDLHTVQPSHQYEDTPMDSDIDRMHDPLDG